MTLTQTIVAPWGIWQEVDYRLFNRLTGEVHEHWSHKFLDVVCNDGRALISYTGIGRLDFDRRSPDISDWIADHLEGYAVSIPDTVKCLQDVASQHLMKYRTPHIFTVGAFIKGQPWAFEISNVELGFDWSDTALLRSFRVYGGQITGQPLVLVRGETRAVSKADWKLLRDETKQRPRRPKRFLKLLAH
jgi:hypothetical protein